MNLLHTLVLLVVLYSHSFLSLLLNLSDASGTNLPIWKILGFVDKGADHVLLVYNRLFVGGNKEFSDLGEWSVGLVPQLGIYSVGDINLGQYLILNFSIN